MYLKAPLSSLLMESYSHCRDLSFECTIWESFNELECLTHSSMISLLIAVIQVYHKGLKSAHPLGVKLLVFLYTEIGTEL
jgi:hypothetical protein